MATPDITITDIADLQSAYDTLSNGGGGTIAIAADDTPLRLMLRDGGGDDAVRIVSADPDAPTLLHQIDLVGVENVTVSGFRVDSTGVDRPDWYDDLRVSGGENITIENTVFTSNAEGRYDPAFEGAILGETFADIRGTDGLTLSGNTVSNYFQGLTVRESTDVQISDNEFTQMQGDGIRLAGVQDVDVTGNHLHNFLGTTHSFNHNDFIQVWSTNTTLTTKNLTISNNIIDAGDGSGGQAIFIGNERAAQGQDHRYENIEVSDNLIHTASRHGITVASADGVKIEDNTVLWNEAARIVVNPGEDGTSRAPQITLWGVEDSTVEGNITSGISGSDGLKTGDNKIVSYGSASDPNHIDKHFVNASGGGTLSANDVRLRPESDWNGSYGSSHTDRLAKSDGDEVQAIFTADSHAADSHVFTLDAGLSVDGQGALGDDYDIRWTLEDGTVLEGAVVRHLFDGAGDRSVTLEILQGGEVVGQEIRKIGVQSKDLVVLDFGRDGVTDTSEYEAGVSASGSNDLGSGGHLIGGDDSISLARFASHVHDLNAFGIDMEMRVLDDDGGRFLLLYKAMQGFVRDDGTVVFALETDEGRFVVDSGDVRIDDGGTHRIGIGYHGEAGELTLEIDGALVGAVEASGTTAPLTHHGLVIGSKWHPGLEAVVSDFHMSSDPGALGLQAGASMPAISLTVPVQAGAEARPVIEVPEEPMQVEDGPTAFLSPEEIGDIVTDVDFEWADGENSGTEMRGFKENGLVDFASGGMGYEISSGKNISVSRWTDDIHEMEAFSFEMDVTADLDDLQGTLVHFYKVMSVRMEEDDRLLFSLQTDQGMFRIEGDGSALTDGGTHRLGISYDDATGAMAMQLDGRTIAEGEAEGITAAESFFGLTVGHTWASSHHNTFDMVVDDIVLATRQEGEPRPAAADTASDTPSIQVMDPTSDDMVF